MLFFDQDPHLLALLIAHGANVNALDAQGNALLAVAVRSHEPEIAQALLAAGADANGTLVGSRGASDTEYATRHESALSVTVGGTRFGQSQPEVARLLLAHGADVNQAERFNAFTPLHLAAWNHDAVMVRLLLDAGADPNQVSTWIYGETALHFAARRGTSELVQALLDAGAEVDGHGHRGQTPLMAVLIRGSSTGARRGQMVALLLDSGADPNRQDATIGNTALHYTARYGRAAEIPILLDHGAAIDQRNRAGDTPLHLAAKWDQERAVSALLEAGAQPDLVNNRGETPADVARQEAIVNMLAAAGAP